MFNAHILHEDFLWNLDLNPRPLDSGRHAFREFAYLESICLSPIVANTEGGTLELSLEQIIWLMATSPSD